MGRGTNLFFLDNRCYNIDHHVAKPATKGDSQMETCSLNEFIKSLRPWLSDNYIRKAHINKDGNFVIDFTDGVRNVYQIDDCTKEQLAEVLSDLRDKGLA